MAEEVQQLRELAAAETPVNVIARKLKRTLKAVRARAKREGIALAESEGEWT
jgi:hypothetical protein